MSDREHPTHDHATAPDYPLPEVDSAWELSDVELNRPERTSSCGSIRCGGGACKPCYVESVDSD